MVFGGTNKERIQFNEHTVWTGKPHSYAHEGAVKFLPEIRNLLFAGKQKDAENLAVQGVHERAASARWPINLAAIS